jgi:multicomponent K+:H+ antiporter subunit G
MMDAAAVPPFIAAVVALLVLVGAALALVGSFGLLRLPTFYERVHPPTMGATLGAGFTLAASVLLFSVLASRPVLHEIIIAVFMVVTTPVTYMLLVRAAVLRDPGRRENAAPETSGAIDPAHRDGEDATSRS